MAKLQINYTNISQSGRLLKMGVPAWSADCTQEKEQGGSFWQHKWIKHEWNNDYDAKDYQKFLDREKDTLPCWSVGRLIEICLKCSTLELRQVRFFCDGDDDEYSLVDYVVTVLESGVMTNHMDFSKLEEG